MFHFNQMVFFSSDHKHSILIPFAVLQELDQLKRRRDEGNPVGLKSARAIKYIYEQLKSKNPRMNGKIINIRISCLNEFESVNRLSSH